MLIRTLFVIVCVIIILASISWKLTLCAVAGIAVTSTGMKTFWSASYRLSTEIQERKARLTEVSEEACSNVRTVKAFACESDEKKKFEVFNIELLIKGKEHAMFEGASKAWTTTMINFTNGLIIYVGN